mgnify:CR=1 FL=1
MIKKKLTKMRISAVLCSACASEVNHEAFSFSIISQMLYMFCILEVFFKRPFRKMKSLRKINEEQFIEAVRINAFPTVLLAKHFMKLMKHKKEAVFAAISARVGSIEDNRAGGWYSYRGSKAMLNMMLSNIAIEFNRGCPNVKVLALHPGTVDTNLSSPFSKNMDPDHLFTPESVSYTHLTLPTKRIV